MKFFLETGTLMGDAIDAVKNNFDTLYSFELSEKLAKDAQNRFCDEKKISIFQGDSSIVLSELLHNIHEPILFWLDGHFSGDFFKGDYHIETAKGDLNTPILEVLKIISNHEIKNTLYLSMMQGVLIASTTIPALKS